MNALFGRFSVLLCAWLCAGTALPNEPEAVEYRVEIEGARDNAVKRAVKESARTCVLRRRPPPTLGQLRRRMEKDVPLIETILEANGYYDGRAALELDDREKPVQVTIRIEQGELYRFRNVELAFAGPPDADLAKIRLRLRRGRAASAQDVFSEQQRIIGELARRGYPFGVLNRRTVTVDRDGKAVDLMLEFDPGMLAYFGPAEVLGLEQIPAKYIHRQIPWRSGERYDAKLVRDFETKLLGTGQFGTARIEPVGSAGGTEAIPMKISLKERDMRTIRLGVNYSDIGPGASILWEHRNIFGGGERLETSLTASPIETTWNGRLVRSGFLDGEQSLVLEAEAAYETPDAYDARGAQVQGLVLRDFNPHIQAGLGLGYRYSEVKQFGSDDRYDYVLFPVEGTLDYRDDRLNPQRGFQVFGQTAWYEDTLGRHSFLKTQAEVRKYQLLWAEINLCAAVRLALGSIDGTDVSGIPADERFYAGGGGSIRGYEYQSVGPNVDGTPSGGSKLLEFSAELRIQPGTRLGYAAFIDGGAVYNDLVDEDSNRALRYGAGLGLRWFTAIGPLRFDAAYPLNPDESQAEGIQFYISLGQAF